MTSQADDSMPSLAYRRLMGLVDPDNQRETISSAEYRERFGQTANDLLRNLDSSHVDTEPECKTEFGQWLEFVSPHPVVAEYGFLPDRKFRADWAIPELKLLFEYDGINAKAHASANGVFRDSEKGNLAQLAGWMFLRVNARSLREESGYTMAMRAISQQGERLSFPPT